MERLLRRKGYLLILASSDGPRGIRPISVELQQRGIEGVIAVGANLPREMQLPVVSVDLGYLMAQEPLAGEMSAWLAELGESAVEAVLRMIETKAVPAKQPSFRKFRPLLSIYPDSICRARDWASRRSSRRVLTRFVERRRPGGSGVCGWGKFPATASSRRLAREPASACVC